MTDTLTRPTAHPRPASADPRTGVRVVVVGALLLVIALVVGVLVAFRYLTADSRRDYLGAGGWPSAGQAALQVGGGRAQLGPNQDPAPIASMAKVMTALVVLRAHPIGAPDELRIRITEADVALTRRQAYQQQSHVEVRAGEVLSEEQALAALLLPSANNVAVFLARTVAGSVPAFVARMNATAARLGMDDTRYTDASGFDPHTVSTAADQLRLVQVASRNPVFARLVATRSYHLPVAGDVDNTDELLGTDGFVGTKTGSHDAAGSCFMFHARRVVAGHVVDVFGVVMGQPGRNLIRAGQYAARQLVDERVGGVGYSAR